MAKKGLLVLVLAVFVVTGAFAIDVSAGFGANFGNHFNNWRGEWTEDLGGGDIDSGTWREAYHFTGGGLFAFFDANFVEANIGLLFGGSLEIRRTYLTFGLLGKIPFEVGNAFTIFPLLGIQYDLGLRMRERGADDPIDFDDWEVDRGDYLNRFWIRFGFGYDINVSHNMFLRTTFLYGINFGTQIEQDANDTFTWGDFRDERSSFHHGLDVRLALGFRF